MSSVLRKAAKDMERLKALPAGADTTPVDSPSVEVIRSGDTHAVAQQEDELANDGPPTPSDVAGAVAEVAEAELVALNGDHFVSVEGGQTFVYRETRDHELDRPMIQRLTPQSFKQLHANRTITVTDYEGNAKVMGLPDAWLKSRQRRTYPGGLAMLPGGTVHTDVYNLWQGFGAVPKAGATKKDAAPALDHIFTVICGNVGAYYEYLVGWLAYGIQYPDRQAEVAVVLLGGRGAGKGTLGRWFRDMYGAHGMHIQQSRHLTGNFNAHLRATLALFVDESFFVGDRAGNSVLKALITEDQMTVEAKGVDAVSVRNRLKIMMATNDSHAILAGTDERRYFVLEVADTMQQNHAYFGKLARWWECGGKEALLGYLASYDISHFDIRKVPNTAALEAQKLASLSPFDSWLLDRLSTGRWEEVTTAKQLAFEFGLHAQERGLRYENAGSDAVGKQLRKRLTVRKVRASCGSREWQLGLPTREDARVEFMANVGIEHPDWGDEGDEGSGAGTDEPGGKDHAEHQ